MDENKTMTSYRHHDLNKSKTSPDCIWDSKGPSNKGSRNKEFYKKSDDYLSDNHISLFTSGMIIRKNKTINLGCQK